MTDEKDKKDEFDELLGDTKIQIDELPAGTQPVAVNEEWDCPTIYTDGLYGMSITQFNARLYFVEHFAQGANLKARHVLNLTMPMDQFQKFVDGLNATLAQVASLPGNKGN